MEDTSLNSSNLLLFQQEHQQKKQFIIQKNNQCVIEEEKNNFAQQQKYLFDLNQSYKDQNLKQDDSDIGEPDLTSMCNNINKNSNINQNKQIDNINNSIIIKNNKSNSSQNNNLLLGTPGLQDLLPEDSKTRALSHIQQQQNEKEDGLLPSNRTRNYTAIQYSEQDLNKIKNNIEQLQRQRKKTSFQQFNQGNSQMQSPLVQLSPIKKQYINRNNIGMQQNQTMNAININNNKNNNNNGVNQMFKLILKQQNAKEFKNFMLGFIQKRKLSKLNSQHLLAISDAVCFLGKIKGKKFKNQRKDQYIYQSQEQYFNEIQDLNQNSIFFKFPTFQTDKIQMFIWNIFMWVLSMLYFVVSPLYFCYYDHFNSITYFGQQIIDYFILFLFVLNIFVKMNTYHGSQENQNLNKNKHIKKYFQKYFIYDLLPLLPVAIGRYVQLTWLFGVLNIWNIIYQQNQIMNYYSLVERYHVTVILFQLIQLILLVSHYTACIFLFIPLYSSSTKGNWLQDREIADEEWQIQFLESFYFSVITMITVGYGDVTPISNNEKCYAIFMALASCGIFGYSVQTIGSIVQENTQRNAELKKKKFEVIKYMRQREITKQLQLKVLKSLKYENQQQDKNKNSGLNIIANISKSLQNEVLKDFFGQTLKQQRIFSSIYSESFLNDLVTCMQEVVLGKNEVLFQQGIFSDKNLYIVTSGQMNVYISRKYDIQDPNIVNNNINDTLTHTIFNNDIQGKNVKRNHSISVQNQKYVKVGSFIKGQLFNHNSFFFDLKTEFQAQCSSNDIVNIAYIPQKQFQQLLKKYPKDYEKFCSFRDDKLQQREVIKDYCTLCQIYQHSTNKCHQVFYQPNKYLTITKSNYSQEQIERRQNKRDRNHKKQFNDEDEFQQYSMGFEKSKIYYNAYLDNQYCKQRLKEIRLDLLPEQVIEKIVEDYEQNDWTDSNDQLFLMRTPVLKFSVDGQFISEIEIEDNLNQMNNIPYDNDQFLLQNQPISNNNNYYQQQQQQYQDQKISDQMVNLNQMQGRTMTQQFKNKQLFSQPSNPISNQTYGTLVSVQQPQSNLNNLQQFNQGKIIISSSENNIGSLHSVQNIKNSQLNYQLQHNDTTPKNYQIMSRQGIKNQASNNYYFGNSEQYIQQQNTSSSRKNSNNMHTNQNQFHSSNLSLALQQQNQQSLKNLSHINIQSQQDVVRSKRSNSGYSQNYIGSNLMNVQGVNSNFNMSNTYFDPPSQQQNIPFQCQEASKEQEQDDPNEQINNLYVRQHSYNKIQRKPSNQTLSLINNNQNQSQYDNGYTNRSLDSSSQNIPTAKKRSFDRISSQKDSFSLPKFTQYNNNNQGRKNSFMTKYKERRTSIAVPGFGQQQEILKTPSQQSYNPSDLIIPQEYFIKRDNHRSNTCSSLRRNSKIQQQKEKQLIQQMIQQNQNINKNKGNSNNSNNNNNLANSKAQQQTIIPHYNSQQNLLQQQLQQQLIQQQILQNQFEYAQNQNKFLYENEHIIFNYMSNNVIPNFEKMFSFQNYKVHNNFNKVIKKYNNYNLNKIQKEKNIRQEKFDLIFQQINNNNIIQNKKKSSNMRNNQSTNIPINQTSTLQFNQNSTNQQLNQTGNNNIKQQNIINNTNIQSFNTPPTNIQQQQQQIQQIYQQQINSNDKKQINIQNKIQEINQKNASQSNSIIFLNIGDNNKKEQFEALTPSRRKPVGGQWDTPKQGFENTSNQVLSVSSSFIANEKNSSQNLQNFKLN